MCGIERSAICFSGRYVAHGNVQDFSLCVILIFIVPFLVYKYLFNERRKLGLKKRVNKKDESSKSLPLPLHSPSPSPSPPSAFPILFPTPPLAPLKNFTIRGRVPMLLPFPDYPPTAANPQTPSRAGNAAPAAPTGRQRGQIVLADDPSSTGEGFQPRQRRTAAAPWLAPC